MSEPENFLSRWSRRKREADDDSARSEQTPESRAPESLVPPPSEQPHDARSAQPADAPEGLADLAKLPSLDQITAETDLSGFLAPGVPMELKTAALRRAWVADPRVKDFVGLNDYDFDFHTPGAIPGFGALEMTDELRREVVRIFAGVPSEQQASQISGTGPVDATSVASQPSEAMEEINAPSVRGPAAPSSQPDEPQESPAPDQSKHAAMQSDQGHVAAQKEIAESEDLQIPARRTHGGALPQ